MTSRIQIYCEALMEAAWLAVVVTIPLFFNLSSTRIFEPDKTYILKFLVVISGVAWLIKRISARDAAQDQTGSVGPQTSFFKLPLILPVLALATLYTLSSIFSISPSESWWGSHVRSQGTIVFYCYSLLFLIVLSELKTSAQLKRLQYAFILTGFTVSAYSILQFLELDSIPWRGIIPDRSAGTMGNTIFLGAYLIMVIPLTFSRFADGISLLRADGKRRAGFLPAACWGAILLIEILALLCTQSRGPVFGLIVAGYICLFLFLVLKRIPGSRSFYYPIMAVGLGCIVPILIVAVVSLVSQLSTFAVAVCLGGTIVCIGTAYLFLWRTPWGRNWLWLTWFVQTVAILLIFVIGPSKIIGREITVPRIGRYTRLSGNSIDARIYLWQTGYSLLSSRSPADLPDGSKDAFHFLRPIVGFGPESIWFPVNLHAPPELIEMHSGTSNRIHNETYDNLIATGFAGALIYLFLISAAIYYALQYTALMSGSRRRIVYIVALTLGSGAGILIPWLAGFPYMAGVCVHAGLLAGLFACIAWSGFQNTEAASEMNSSQIFVICIVGSLIAHFVETAVGIAITPTRTYFFLLLAVLAVLASHRLKKDASSKKRSSKPQSWLRTPLPAFIAIASFAVLIEAWCFIINTTAERSAVKLFVDNWFVGSSQQPGFFLPGNLILLLLTIVGGLALIYAEKSNFHLSKRDSRKIRGVFSTSMIVVWLAMGFLSAAFWAARDPSVSAPVDMSVQSETRITLFLLGLLVLLAATVSALAAVGARKYSASFSVRNPSSWLALLLLIAAFAVIFSLTLRPAWADIAYHIARAYDRAGNFPAAMQIYERAVHLAPGNTRYLISLGQAQSNPAAQNSRQLREQEAERNFQRAIELNPLDPAGYHALGAHYMSLGERAIDTASRNAQLRKAIPQFQQAARLAPGNKTAYNNLGRCYFLSGDYEKAIESYEKTLEMHPDDEMAYMYIGEVQYALNDLEGALQSFSEAARLEKRSLEARKNIGSVLIRLGRKEEAIREDLATLEMAPQDLTLLRRLSSLYFSIEDYSSGLAYARRAYEATPEEEKPGFDAFLKRLQNQFK